MYGDEVLGKRVVVQHIPLGGIFEWNVQDEDEHHEEEDSPYEEKKANPDLLSAPAPFIPTQAAIRGSPQSMNEPLPGEAPSPKRSPLSLANPLPSTRGTAVPPSPHRQGTMPRPKGGRLAAALTATGPSVSNPPSAVSPTEAPISSAGSGLTLPAVGSEKMRATTDDEYSVPPSAAEPDLRKDPEILQPPTSPQNVAKILNANPVDHRSINATPTEEVPAFTKPTETVIATTATDRPVESQTIEPTVVVPSADPAPPKALANTGESSPQQAPIDEEAAAVKAAPPLLTTADTTGKKAKAKVEAAAGEHGKGCFGLKCTIM